MNIRRTVPAALALTIGLAGLASPAFAEGSFTSHMSGWLTGLSTRSWDDANSDDNSTTFGAKGCSYETGDAVASITMELNRNDTWTPDEHYGNKKVTCTPTSATHTVGWGDKGKGNFDMTLKQIDGSTVSKWGHLYVDYVKIAY